MLLVNSQENSRTSLTEFLNTPSGCFSACSKRTSLSKILAPLEDVLFYYSSSFKGLVLQLLLSYLLIKKMLSHLFLYYWQPVILCFECLPWIGLFGRVSSLTQPSHFLKEPKLYAFLISIHCPKWQSYSILLLLSKRNTLQPGKSPQRDYVLMFVTANQATVKSELL